MIDKKQILTKSTYLCLSLLTAFSVNFKSAQAADFQPGDFVPLPYGTNLLLLYYNFQNSDKLVNGDGHNVPQSALQTHVGVFRFDHYFNIGNLETDLTFVLPFGGFTKAKQAGVNLRHSNFSAGDAEFVFTFWPINNPESHRYLAIATYFNVPTGQYQSNTPVSLGDNRGSVNFQPDFYFMPTPKISFDIGGDLTIWGHNNNPYGGGTLVQDPSGNSIVWATYHFTPATNLSLGVLTSWIGEEKLDGRKLGSGMSVTPRIALIHQTSATSEALLQLSTDAYARNTYKNNIGVLLRWGIVF